MSVPFPLRPLRSRALLVGLVAASFVASACGGDAGAVGGGGIDDTGGGDSGRPGGRDTGVRDTSPLDARIPLPPIADAGEDLNGTAGRPIIFDGSASGDPDGEIVSWTWETGTGATLNGEMVNFTYAAEGVFIVTLTVTDDDGLSASDTLTVDLVSANSAPVPVITGPRTVVRGESAEWDGRDSYDDIGIVSWTWETGVEDVDLFDGAELDYAYPEWGVYTLSLTVMDTDGTEATATREITVQSQPEAVIGAPVSVYEGEEVALDGSESHDPDGVVVEWHWDFLDGSTGTGPLPRHTWTEPGDYDVTLTVTDDDGLIGSTVHKLTVDPLPNVTPTALADSDRATVLTFEDVAFSAERSTDPDGAIADYHWDFGDGTDLVGSVVTHQYHDDGVYEAQLTVTDDEGGVGTAAVSVTVENRPPVATIEAPDVVTLGLDATFNGGTSTDIDGEVVSFRWEFGDGSPPILSASTTTAHTYASTGTYTVRLTVTDDDGATGTTEYLVQVDDEPPPTGDFDGSWVVSPVPRYTCTFGIVNVNVPTLLVTDARPTIALAGGGAQPGTMTGTFTSGDAFHAENLLMGACDELYEIDGEFTGEDTMTATLRATFTGSCFGCVSQVWNITATR